MRIIEDGAAHLGTAALAHAEDDWRSSSPAIVSALIMPRSADHTDAADAKARRNRSTTGNNVVTSAVLPGHSSEHSGLPS